MKRRYELREKHVLMRHCSWKMGQDIDRCDELPAAQQSNKGTEPHIWGWIWRKGFCQGYSHVIDGFPVDGTMSTRHLRVLVGHAGLHSRSSMLAHSLIGSWLWDPPLTCSFWAATNFSVGHNAGRYLDHYFSFFKAVHSLLKGDILLWYLTLKALRSTSFSQEGKGEVTVTHSLVRWVMLQKHTETFDVLGGHRSDRE